MALTKRQADSWARWGERVKSIAIAALSAIAARAAEDDVALAVVSIVVLVAAGEVVTYLLVSVRARAQLQRLAQRNARRVGFWMRQSVGDRRKRKRGPRDTARAGNTTLDKGDG